MNRLIFLAAYLVCSTALGSGAFYDTSNGSSLPISGGTLTGNIQMSCAHCWIYETAQTTDAGARALTVRAGDAYPQAATNVTGGVLTLAGGLGRELVTVSNYALCGGAGTFDRVLVDITTAGAGTVRTTLTAGAEFTCATSNNATAASLATAIAAISGVASATAPAAVVYVSPSAGSTVGLWLSVADGGVDGAFAAATNTTSAVALAGNGTDTTSTVYLLTSTSSDYGLEVCADRACSARANIYTSNVISPSIQTAGSPLVVIAPGIQVGIGGPTLLQGTGNPEGVKTAGKGSLYLRTDGSTGTTFYVKEAGASNTGWVAK